MPIPMSSVLPSDVTIRTTWQSGDIGMVTYLHGILYKQEFNYSLALCGNTSSYLWTTDDCTEAIALYTRYGFRLVEEKATSAFDRPVVEQRYEWLAT